MAISLKKIICAVDFSIVSDAVIHYAAEMHGTNMELIVLHVASEGEKNKGLHGIHLSEFSRYSDILQKYRVKSRFAILYGEPAICILNYAAEHEADMILIGSHGTKAIGRLLVGSTAESVMRNAHCPVVVMKIPDNNK
ncbi:MAG: universal stress protein [Chlorobiaceae bacterium]